MILENFVIDKNLSEDSYLTLISILSKKFGGVKNEYPEFIWDRMKKTIGYTLHEVIFKNGFKIKIVEKHRISFKEGYIKAGAPINYNVVNTIGFSY